MTEQAQAPPQPQEDPINKVLITLRLPVIVVNQILAAVSKLPYEHAAGTIAMIREQGDEQVNLARASLTAAHAATPPAPSAPLAPPPANANRKARRKAAAKKG